MGIKNTWIVCIHARIRSIIGKRNRHSKKDLTMYTDVQKRKVIQEIQAILAQPNARTAAQHRLYQLKATLLKKQRKTK